MGRLANHIEPVKLLAQHFGSFLSFIDLVNLNRASTNISDRIGLFKIMAAFGDHTHNTNDTHSTSKIFHKAHISIGDGHFFTALHWHIKRKINLKLFHIETSNSFSARWTYILQNTCFECATSLSLLGGSVAAGVAVTLLGHCMSIEHLAFENNPKYAINFEDVARISNAALERLRSVTLVHGKEGEIMLLDDARILQFFIWSAVNCKTFKLQCDTTSCVNALRCDEAQSYLKKCNPKAKVTAFMDMIGGITTLTVEMPTVFSMMKESTRFSDHSQPRLSKHNLTTLSRIQKNGSHYEHHHNNHQGFVPSDDLSSLTTDPDPPAPKRNVIEID